MPPEAMSSSPAVPPAHARAHRATRIFAAVAIGCVVAYALLSLVFVFRGRLNADEGWYLYGSRLAWRGQLPYADFAFPQMPLTAYVYGLGQTITASLYVGRLTSLVLGVAAVALSVRVAWREAGKAAAVAVAVLVVAFPTGVYNLTLTKTYALAAFLLAVVLAALTSPGRTSRTWPLAVAASIALLATRTTGLPLAILVVVWCIARARDRVTRRNVVVVAGAGTAILAAFLLADVGAARYDLVTFHGLLWRGADVGSRVETIVRDRIPDWLGDYPGYVALLGAALLAVFLSRPLRAYLRRTPGVAIVGLGILGALASQLVSGEWAPVEYASPVIPSLLAVTVIVLTHALRPEGGWNAHRALGIVAGVAVAALAVSTVFHPGPAEYFTGPDNPGSINAADRVGDYLNAHTRSGDEVLTLWAQPAGLASGRDNVPGITMGLFSYEDLTTQQALDFHYVNTDRLRRTLRDGRAAAVVLTGVDDTIFHSTGTFSRVPQDPAEVLDALSPRYRLAHRAVGWGPYGPVPVRIYLRTDRT